MVMEYELSILTIFSSVFCLTPLSPVLELFLNNFCLDTFFVAEGRYPSE